MSVSLVKLRIDVVVGVEIRSWWRQIYWHYISHLGLLDPSDLDGPGKHVCLLAP
jgi:hypothetical protein